MKSKFFLTSAIPYVNAAPHIGHAQEFVYADVIRRYHQLLGKQVLYLCGSDENALKNVQAAELSGIPVQKFIDANAQFFQELASKLNVQFDVFQKGTDTKTHFPSSQKLWNLCYDAGDIYKKSYHGLYCLGCESFYTKDELNENGECFEHPGKKIESVSEENYFFRLSKYQQKIINLLSTDHLRIVPEIRKNEVFSFLKLPLQDISISRTNDRAKNWGVPVPGDLSQRMYVWFDALNIYQSGIGFGWDETLYKKWAPQDVMVIGKGISRFHAVYWPAFLMSAKLPIPKELFVHGYLTVDGKKMSKTVGNVVDPFAIIEKYGADAVRYYLLREIPSYADGDFSERRFKEVYNADLANGLGNLVARTLKMIDQFCDGKIPPIEQIPDTHPLRINPDINNWKKSWKGVDEGVSSFQFQEALASVWKFITESNKYIDDNKPWELTKKDQKALNWVLYGLADSLHQLAWQIHPFLPETSQKIAHALNMKRLIIDSPDYKDSWTHVQSGTPISTIPPLFPRHI